jgi:hypothetical protein
MLRHAILLSLSLGVAVPAFAADYTVTRFDDPAPNGCAARDCSLREALIAANVSPGPDRVVLAAGTYALSRLANGAQANEAVGPLWVRDDTDFVGVGHGTGGTHVRWSDKVLADSPVFRAWAGGDGELDVGWSRMKISHGRYAGSGGCVDLSDHSSNYRLDRVIVRDCEAISGGGISVTQATLTLVDSVVEFNTASFDGGGIHLSYDSTLVTANARIRYNGAERDGGGVRFNQAFLTNYNDAFWFDDGRTQVSGNHAGRDGGGLAVGGDIRLHLDGSEPDSLQRLSFGKNHAGRGGGAIARGDRFVAFQPMVLNLRQVHISYNFAPDGGGLYALQPVDVEDVEFRGNATTDSATAGSGGGVYLKVESEPSRIARSTFWLNDAGAMAGGAVFNKGCGALTLENVSMHGNTASRGAAIGSHAALELRHVTATGNTGTYAELYQYYIPLVENCGSTYAVVANSLIGERCSTRYSSAGGNQYGPDAAACVSTASDQRQAGDAVFGLAAGTYGGSFTVMGWPSDGTPRPQRDFGLAANCSAFDVRGLPRADGFCDAGAFEQQP